MQALLPTIFNDWSFVWMRIYTVGHFEFGRMDCNPVNQRTTRRKLVYCWATSVIKQSKRPVLKTPTMRPRLQRGSRMVGVFKSYEEQSSSCVVLYCCSCSMCVATSSQLAELRRFDPVYVLPLYRHHAAEWAVPQSRRICSSGGRKGCGSTV